MQRNCFLRPNVVARPLVGQWYARDISIPPAPAAMYVRNGYIELMKSYLKAPEYHAKAAFDPDMIGGPWIGHGVERVSEIAELLERTENEQSHLIQLADAIDALDSLLRNEANGRSLEPLYSKVPAALRGYVELVYDINSNPAIRFIEPMLYRSRYYTPSLQSFAFSLIHQDYRPYQWFTPWLPDNESVHVAVPFNDPRLDKLFGMTLTPGSADDIRDALNIEAKDEELFSSFFTEEQPPARDAYRGDGVRIRYFGHACLLIESSGVSILTDPIVSYKYRSELSRLTYCDLPERIDFLILTHGHFDHFNLETLIQLRHRTGRVIVKKNGGGAIQDPSLKLILRQIGFTDVVEVDELDPVDVGAGTVTALPFFGEHCDLNIQAKAAHLIEMKGNTMLFAADSCNVEPVLYEHLREMVGNVDLLFLGMESVGAPLTNGYGPLLTKAIDRRHDQSRRTTGSNCERAIDIVRSLGVKRAYVYAMGMEPWLRHVLALEEIRDSQGIVDSNMFVEECSRMGVEAERLYGSKEIILPPK